MAGGGRSGAHLPPPAFVLTWRYPDPMPRIVIALGGNALGLTPAEQLQRIRSAVPALLGMITPENEIIVTHGNGPQVGAINNAFRMGSAIDPGVPELPFPEATAMSQGYIGYHLQQEMLAEIERRNKPWHVATVVTQVRVDPDDPAFSRPTKPIGSFVTQSNAERAMAADPSLVFREDAGRGWRRVVASPRPLDIVEKDSILNLLDADFIVVACGGGGIPVIRRLDGHGYLGVDAVIDKDFCAALLAEAVGADTLCILTAVERVAIGWGTSKQQWIAQMSLEQARAYIDAGEFAEGSMLPKVQAALGFVEGGEPGERRAVICRLDQAPLAMMGQAGTLIYS